MPLLLLVTVSTVSGGGDGMQSNAVVVARHALRLLTLGIGVSSQIKATSKEERGKSERKEEREKRSENLGRTGASLII